MIRATTIDIVQDIPKIATSGPRAACLLDERRGGMPFVQDSLFRMVEPDLAVHYRDRFLIGFTLGGREPRNRIRL
jgi:hypothetical protein